MVSFPGLGELDNGGGGYFSYLGAGPSNCPGMGMNDPSVVAFEQALCEYTGAPYAVAMKRCCIALKGCCEYLNVKEVTIPRYTYEFVPQALVRSNVLVRFDDRVWSGGYNLLPTPIWDYARRFRPRMYKGGQYQCLSFHRSKILGHTEGGAVLTNDVEAWSWLRQWRDDGRQRGHPQVIKWVMIGESGLMYPDIAVNLTLKLHWLKQDYPKGHPDLSNSNYPDLSKTDWNGIWRDQLQR